MANYCGECTVWRGSGDENKYGERWCSYSRRYERSDQNTYGCKGFVWARPSSSGCFLTTACVEYKQLSDDCAELMAMRQLRDTWLQYQPNGRAEIEAYYSYAPEIVQNIKLSVNAEKIWDTLYTQYIVPCQEAVEREDMEGAYLIYRQMIEYAKAV